MIMHPAIIALFGGSLVVVFLVIAAFSYGVKILKHWDLKSGSEMQLNLEKKTYLISTIMSYAFVFQLFSFFLFIFTADKLAGLFTGAMCAAGTLNVNDFGYPTLLLKIVTFVLGGVWLVINYTDNMAIDYALIRKKYLFLVIIAPIVLLEAGLQGAYFFNLNANVITSCCGSLFSAEGAGVGSIFVTALPVFWMKIVFYASVISTVVCGYFFYKKGSAATGYTLALLSVATFIISITAVISFISLYFYELPTHHCPFCILQSDYNWIGYPLYLSLLCGVVTGVSVGFLMPARHVESLKYILPLIQKRLTLAALISYSVFAIISTLEILFSNLIL